jgi:hypothetical protein
MADDGGSGQGPATNRLNEPVRDPTENVRELVLAEAKYQSAMREMSDKQLKEVLDRDRQYTEKMLDMRADFARTQFEREREHNQEVRTMESSRIDAIRQVDVAAGQQAAIVQATTATTLAGQVAAAAEAMRTANAAATASFTQALATAVAPLNEAIADLRRAQYEAQGQKAQVVETRSAAEDLRPMFDQLQQLIVAQATTGGGQQQRTESRLNLGAVLGGVSVLLVLIFGVLTLVQ